MSSVPNTSFTSSNFQDLIDAALKKYTECTGKDLCNHPLAYLIDGCDSPDAILKVFKEQYREFDEFRNGDSKLLKWLEPVVNGLYSISTEAALSAGVSLVSPTKFRILLLTYFNPYL